MVLAVALSVLVNSLLSVWIAFCISFSLSVAVFINTCSIASVENLVNTKREEILETQENNLLHHGRRSSSLCSRASAIRSWLSASLDSSP